MKKWIAGLLTAAMLLGLVPTGLVGSALDTWYLSDHFGEITAERSNLTNRYCQQASGIFIYGDDQGVQKFSKGILCTSAVTTTGNGSNTTWFKFTAPSGYNRFVGRVGVCYHATEAEYNNRHRVRIFVNNSQKYLSPMLKTKSGYDFSVPVSGGDQVLVEVYGAGNQGGHICFGDPRFVVDNTEHATIKFSTESPAPDVPITAILENYTLKDGETLSYLWTLDGETVSTEGGYTPKTNDYGKVLTLTVSGSQSGTLAHNSLYISRLPVISITTDTGGDVVNKTEYLSGTLRAYGNEQFPTDSTFYDGKVSLRGRGNSSWTFRKKSYRLKLKKKASLYGMPKSKHWLLIANCYDETEMRNKMAYDLAAQMGMTSMKSQWVTVTLNGVDIGTYQLCEQIRVAKDRVAITDWDGIGEDIATAIAEKNTGVDPDDLTAFLEEDLSWVSEGKVTYKGATYKISDYYTGNYKDITGGYLLQMEYDPAKEQPEDISRFWTKYGLKFNIKKPDYTRTNKAMLDYIKGYIGAVEDACLSDTYTTKYGRKTVSYTDLVDLDSLCKNFLINELFYNPDAGYNSNYMYKDRGGKLIIGPVWDFDTAMASKGGAGTQQYDQWQVDISRADPVTGKVMQSVWYRHLLGDPQFVVRVYELYHQYRDLFESYAKEGGVLDESYQYLEKDLKHNTDLWQYKVGYKQDYYNAKVWLGSRLSWLDEQFQSVTTLFNSLNNYSDSEELEVTAETSNGAVIPSDGNVEYSSEVRFTFRDLYSGSETVRVTLNGKNFATVKVNENTGKAYINILSSKLKIGINTFMFTAYDYTGEATGKLLYTVNRQAAVSGCKHPNSKRAVIGKRATSCAAAGYTGDTVCTDCGKVFSKGKTVKATAHSFYYKKELKKATYFGAGSGVGNCSKCGGRIKYTIPKLTLKTPSGFKAKSYSYNKVKLSWSKVSGASDYVIYKKSGKSWKYVKAVSSKTTSYTVSGLKTGSKYTYSVRARVKSGSKSAYSAYAPQKTVQPVPSAPKLTVKKRGKKATVTVKKVSGASGYRISTASSKNGKYKTAKYLSSKAGSYTLKNKKYVKVEAYRKVGSRKVYGKATVKKL